MDGTAAINRKKRGRRGGGAERKKGSREEKSGTTEIKRGRERGRIETEREQVGEGTKKRDIRVSSPCKWWHSPCSDDSTRNVFFSPLFFWKKKAGEAVPGLLWHGDEHPTLSLCQSRCIPRPWQQLLATSSSCVKSAYVLMNVSARPNRVIAACVSIHLREPKFEPRCTWACVTLVGNYLGLNNYVGPWLGS